MHYAYAYDEGRGPLNGAVYGIIRVRPTPTGLSLELAEDAWRMALDVVLPAPDPDLDVDGLTISGVPGLRVRTVTKGRGTGRFELFRPGQAAAITVHVPRDEADDAREGIARIAVDGDPMHQAPQWTAAEQEQLPAYERWLGDPWARSRVLRRLLAFRDLPRVRVISDDGRVPTPQDFQQILAARRTSPRRVPVRAGSLPRPTLSQERPLLVAVVGTRVGPLGGQGRTSVTMGLAKALVECGRGVMVVDGSAGGAASARFRETPDVPVVRAHSRRDVQAERLQERATWAGAEIVLIDGGPMDQDLIAEVADYWIGVVNPWQRPTWKGPLATIIAEDANAQPLTGDWHEQWLDVMRRHHWRVSWRITPGAGIEEQLAPYARSKCAGVVLLGEHRDRPGARAEDYLTGVTTELPIASPAVPFVPDIQASHRAEQDAYLRLAAALFR